MSTHQRALDEYRHRIEAAAIAGLILKPAAIDHVRDWLEPADFATPHYGDWYAHLLNMRGRGEPIDQMTLLTALRRADQLGPQGQNADELATITTSAPVPASTIEYCRIVLEESIRDEIASVGVRLSQLARRSSMDGARLLAQARALTEHGLRPLEQAQHRSDALISAQQER
ncbi:MAG TPA: DnaB-like helicase N-terminal domain-containing protein [Nocardioidaceae bacterium]|nr:DnaB-like helicase N-terminal domain-containing protein [Nocardioidaceae bacterium]